MNHRPLVIANPRSAGGQTGARWRTIQAEIEAAIGSIDVRCTEWPLHATQIAREAVEQGRRWIVAVGGDGTGNEVVNGMIQKDCAIRPETALSFLMQGTGNDFRKTFAAGRPRDQDITALAGGKTQKIDVGKVTFRRQDGQEQTRYFMNLSSFGMSAEVVRRVNQGQLGRFLSGPASFRLASFLTLLSYRNKRVRIAVDDQLDETIPIRLVAVANGQYAGGGMWLAPGAKLDDGTFDVVILKATGVFTVLRNFHKLYKGTHVAMPQVHHLQGKRITVTSDENVSLEVDGEDIGRLPASFEILPSALLVRG